MTWTDLSERYSQELANVGVGIVEQADERARVGLDSQVRPVRVQGSSRLPGEVRIVRVIRLATNAGGQPE